MDDGQISLRGPLGPIASLQSFVCKLDNAARRQLHNTRFCFAQQQDSVLVLSGVQGIYKE